MATCSQLMKAVQARDAIKLEKLAREPSSKSQFNLIPEGSMRSALGEAASLGDAGCVRALIRAGADVNEFDAIGQSPLHWAAFKGSAEVIEMLIEAGADIEAPLRNGVTRPIHTAFRSRQLAAVEALARAGADVLAPMGERDLLSMAKNLIVALGAVPGGQDATSERAVAFARGVEALFQRAELDRAVAPSRPWPSPAPSL